MLARSFQIGECRVDPNKNSVVGPEGEQHLQPKVMDVLVLLAQRAGEVITHRQFMDRVWSDAFVGDDSLVRCISTLRKVLDGGNGSSHNGNGSAIQTIPKRGYCLVAPVSGLSRQRLSASSRKTALFGRSRVTLQAILASCTDHVYVYDREERYVLVSAAAAQAIGREVIDIVGKTWRDLGMPAEVMEPFFERVASVFVSGASIRERVSYPTIEGEQDYEYILDPIVQEGEVFAVLALVREL